MNTTEDRKEFRDHQLLSEVTLWEELVVQIWHRSA